MTFWSQVYRIRILKDTSASKIQNKNAASQKRWVKTAKAFSSSDTTHKISNPRETISITQSIVMITLTPKAIIWMIFRIKIGKIAKIRTMEKAYQEYSHSTDLDNANDITIGKMYIN